MGKKELFEIALENWRADNEECLADLEIVEICEEQGAYKALAQDEQYLYEIADRGDGNLEINYLGKR